MVRPTKKKHGTAQPLYFFEKTLKGERSQDELTPRSDPCYVWGLGSLDLQGDPMRDRTRTMNRPSQPNQGNPMSHNKRSEVFPYEKTCEGVPYSSIGSRATPTECARVHPQAVENPPERSLPDRLGARGLLSIPILG
jgi:hypothetical protein